MEENISHALNSGTLFLPRDNPAQRSPFLMGLQSSQAVEVDNDCVWCTLAALMNVSVLEMVNFTEQIHFSPHDTAMYPQQIDMILAQIELSLPETRTFFYRFSDSTSSLEAQQLAEDLAHGIDDRQVGVGYISPSTNASHIVVYRHETEAAPFDSEHASAPALWRYRDFQDGPRGTDVTDQMRKKGGARLRFVFGIDLSDQARQAIRSAEGKVGIYQATPEQLRERDRRLLHPFFHPSPQQQPRKRSREDSVILDLLESHH